MGYLTCFNLRPYAPGVILETPTVGNPNELPEYKEIPKMARLFWMRKSGDASSAANTSTT